MKAAVPFYRQYVALREQSSRFPHWVFSLNCLAASGCQIRFWSAWWASHGLRVKTPVSWVIVFALAEAAEGELAHGGVFSVVRQPLDDCEAWSAVGAGDKEVVEAWVFGVTELAKAFLQMAMSGGMIEPELCRVRALVNGKVAVSLPPESSVDLTTSMWASGGFCSVRSRMKLLMFCVSPSKRISTPASPRLRTYPAKPFRTAMRYTKGRKPTP